MGNATKQSTNFYLDKEKKLQKIIATLKIHTLTFKEANNILYFCSKTDDIQKSTLMKDIFPKDFYDSNPETNEYYSYHKAIFQVVSSKLNDTTSVAEIMFYLFPFFKVTEDQENESKSVFDELFRKAKIHDKAYNYIKFFTVEINNCLKKGVIDNEYECLNEKVFKEKTLKEVVSEFEELEKIGGLRKCATHLGLDSFEKMREVIWIKEKKKQRM